MYKVSDKLIQIPHRFRDLGHNQKDERVIQSNQRGNVLGQNDHQSSVVDILTIDTEEIYRR